MSREAMQMALDALEEAHHVLRRSLCIEDAIVALRAALAQGEAPCPHIRSSGMTHWCALAESQPKPAEDDLRRGLRFPHDSEGTPT